MLGGRARPSHTKNMVFDMPPCYLSQPSGEQVDGLLLWTAFLASQAPVSIFPKGLTNP